MTRHKDGSMSTFLKDRNLLVVGKPTVAAKMQARAITLITSAISTALGSKAVPVSITAAAIVLARNIKSKRLSPTIAAREWPLLRTWIPLGEWPRRQTRRSAEELTCGLERPSHYRDPARHLPA